MTTIHYLPEDPHSDRENIINLSNALAGNIHPNPMPFGLNPDGSRNEREAEVIRFVLAKHLEYFFDPPQELLAEAYSWAASEGITLNNEEAADMARIRLSAYIAKEVLENFPDVRFRKAPHTKSNYPVGLKYPSRAFSGEEIINRDIHAQVQDIMSRS